MNIPSSYYPNKVGRIFLLAMEEIMGTKGINAALNTARLPHWINNYPPNNLEMQFPSQELSIMQAALENLYGLQSGRGLAWRSGRACFRYSLREFGIDQSNPGFRLLPLNQKLKLAAEMFANAFNQFSGQRVDVVETRDHFICEIAPCPICAGRHSDEPICYLVVGFLQESLYWISNGKFFRITETHCIAKGDDCCRMEIDKRSLE